MKIFGVAHMYEKRPHPWLRLKQWYMKLNGLEYYYDKDGIKRIGRHIQDGDILKLNPSHLLRLNLDRELPEYEAPQSQE